MRERVWCGRGKGGESTQPGDEKNRVSKREIYYGRT